MLTDKYKPINFENFVGNPQNIESLQNWLINWDLQNKSIKKCVLISGSSGIGKTLCIDLLIKKFNLNPTYISPDEEVDKKFFQDFIIPSIKIEKNILLKKNILVIHDIDCYYDYGFITNVGSCIKESKIPVIMTCNNRYEQSLKPIINYCFDIKFQKPFVSDIIKFLVPIIKKECHTISQSQLKQVIEESNCDIRNILLNLQLNFSKNITIENTHNIRDVCKSSYINLKDKTIAQTNIFDLTKTFMCQNIDINEKNSLFWLNNDILPLMVHENYPLNIIKMRNESNYLQNMASSIGSLSDIDLIDKEIKREASNWELLPYIGWNLIKCVDNCHVKTQVKFTGFLTKIAQRNKNKNNNSNSKKVMIQKPKATKKTTNPIKPIKSIKPNASKKVKLIIEED
jgi:replication factor C subunit 1